MSKNQRGYFLFVPSAIIRGENCKLDSKTFVVFCYLLHQEFLSSKKGETMLVNHQKMKIITNILDNRTLKRCLNQLNECGLIKEKIDNLNIKHLTITLTDRSDYKYFTKMPIAIFEHIHKIGHVGFRLLFYYESFINRKRMYKQFAFPSYETIKRDLAITDSTLSKYNAVLVQEGVMSIIRLEAETKEGEFTFMKWHNKYHLALNKL